MSIASLCPEYMKELENHGHPEYWEIATYGQHVTVECIRCGEVLLQLTPEEEETNDKNDVIDQDIALLTEEICPELTQIFHNIRRGQNTLFLGKVGYVSIICRLTNLLSEMNDVLKKEVEQIYQSLGKTRSHKRPFRVPHYSIGVNAMRGTVEKGKIKYGELSLAHGGILFLDEFTEFSPEVLSCIQLPMSKKTVSFYEDDTLTNLPANFILVGS